MELLDVVNARDEVIGQEPIDIIYQRQLPIRIVHVLVFNGNGEMALQKRSKHERVFPLHWSTSAGGHVQSGETYREAAIRELKEELGINGELQHLAADKYVDTIIQNNHVKF